MPLVTFLVKRLYYFCNRYYKMTQAFHIELKPIGTKFIYVFRRSLSALVRRRHHIRQTMLPENNRI